MSFGKGDDSGEDAAAAANLASNKQIEELQRQFDVTQANISPFIEAGAGALGTQIDAATIGGLDERLGQITNTNVFGNLVDERSRAVQGGLAAGGLNRSGAGLQSLANVPQDIALQIENMLSGRTTQLAGSGQNAAVGLGSLGQQSSQSIGSALAQQGQNISSGILADQQSNAQGTQNLISTGATAASIFFSDPRLKENVEQISEIGDLGVYQWDWIEGAKGTIIEACQTIGFMADEVEEKYPHHVSEFGGFMVVNYENLLDELGGKYANFS